MSIAVETLIPHRPPMRWIDSVGAVTATSATAFACFDPGHFAVSDGMVLESALIECMAQTAAAFLGYRQQEGEESRARPGGGMLAAVTAFQVQARLPAGKKFQIEIRELKQFGPMLMVAGVVSCEAETIASGELTLYA